MNKLIVSVLVSLFAQAAMADQCQVLSGNQAARALEILNRSATVLEYCPNCGDTTAKRISVNTLQAQVFDVSLFAAGAIVRVGDLTAAAFVATATARFTLLVDGLPVDMAYLYSESGMNLGNQAGCLNDAPTVILLAN